LRRKKKNKREKKESWRRSKEPMTIKLKLTPSEPKEPMKKQKELLESKKKMKL